jgi:hypothetical protein
MLQSFLFKIEDHRRKQGLRYQQGHILLISILAILSGATSYRKIHQFIVSHYADLDAVLALNWKRMPAYTTIRGIIQNTNDAELEKTFRAYSSELGTKTENKLLIGYDGKTLRGSFDHFQDQRAIQLLTAFTSEENFILAHEEIEQKTNEIPVAQQLMEKLGLTDCIFTLDALHCQKNARGR